MPNKVLEWWLGFYRFWSLKYKDSRCLEMSVRKPPVWKTLLLCYYKIIADFVFWTHNNSEESIFIFCFVKSWYINDEYKVGINWSLKYWRADVCVYYNFVIMAKFYIFQVNKNSWKLTLISSKSFTVQSNRLMRSYVLTILLYIHVTFWITLYKLTFWMVALLGLLIAVINYVVDRKLYG